MAEPKSRGDQKRDETNPEFDNFQRLLKDVLSVPKKKIDEKRDEYEREREKGRRAG